MNRKSLETQDVLGAAAARRAKAAIYATLLVTLTAGGCSCEDDDLISSSNPEPPTCEEDDQFCDNSGQLDAGFPVPLDSGVDAGAGMDVGFVDAGLVDTGATPDATPMDAMVPDTGPPDTGPPPPEFLDVVGCYSTEYELDVTNALGGIGNLGGPLDIIAQTLNGNVEAVIDSQFGPIIAAIVAPFIDQVIQSIGIPSWVVDVVNVLNSLAQFFSDFRATGELRILTQTATGTDPNINLLTGDERWLQVIVMIIDQCPMGTFDPAYPGCAEFPLTVATPPAMAGPTDIEVDPDPFTGILRDTPMGMHEADIEFYDRGIDVEFWKIVRIVADFLISQVTPYNSVADAITAAVDCQAFGIGIGNLVGDAVCNPGCDPQAVAVRLAAENACDNTVSNIVNQIVGGLNGVGIGWELLEFDQFGHAVDQMPYDNKPDVLQVMTQPNTIDGRISTIGNASMGGVWQGYGTGLLPDPGSRACQ